MPSGFETLLDTRVKPIEEPAPQAARIQLPQPLPVKTFWHEFVRVETDKILLIGLIIFLHFVHAADTLQAAVIGGLVMAIQGQRYSRTEGRR